MKLILTLNLFLLLFSKNIMAQEKGQKVIYKYKQYETIDLGGLEIKGNIVAPGDISVKERDRKEFQRELLDRPNFDQEIKEDVTNLR